jgi:hypothetical protein
MAAKIPENKISLFVCGGHSMTMCNVENANNACTSNELIEPNVTASNTFIVPENVVIVFFKPLCRTMNLKTVRTLVRNINDSRVKDFNREIAQHILSGDNETALHIAKNDHPFRNFPVNTELCVSLCGPRMRCPNITNKPLAYWPSGPMWYEDGTQGPYRDGLVSNASAIKIIKENNSRMNETSNTILRIAEHIRDTIFNDGRRDKPLNDVFDQFIGLGLFEIQSYYCMPFDDRKPQSANRKAGEYPGYTMNDIHTSDALLLSDDAVPHGSNGRYVNYGDLYQEHIVDMRNFMTRHNKQVLGKYTIPIDTYQLILEYLCTNVLATRSVQLSTIAHRLNHDNPHKLNILYMFTCNVVKLRSTMRIRHIYPQNIGNVEAVHTWHMNITNKDVRNSRAARAIAEPRDPRHIQNLPTRKKNQEHSSSSRLSPPPLELVRLPSSSASSSSALSPSPSSSSSFLFPSSSSSSSSPSSHIPFNSTRTNHGRTHKRNGNKHGPSHSRSRSRSPNPNGKQSSLNNRNRNRNMRNRNMRKPKNNKSLYDNMYQNE